MAFNKRTVFVGCLLLLVFVCSVVAVKRESAHTKRGSTHDDSSDKSFRETKQEFEDAKEDFMIAFKTILNLVENAVGDDLSLYRDMILKSVNYIFDTLDIMSKPNTISAINTAIDDIFATFDGASDHHLGGGHENDMNSMSKHEFYDFTEYIKEKYSDNLDHLAQDHNLKDAEFISTIRRFVNGMIEQVRNIYGKIQGIGIGVTRGMMRSILGKLQWFRGAEYVDEKAMKLLTVDIYKSINTAMHSVNSLIGKGTLPMLAGMLNMVFSQKKRKVREEHEDL